MKIRLVGAELFHVDGRTDEPAGRQTDRQRETGTNDEAHRRFSQFCESG